MANQNKFLFVLTSLQIGDIQSYVSKLYLHVDHKRKKLVFFVDNGPWKDKISHSKSVELWQLMVTQSRKSPFTNQCQRFDSRCSMKTELNTEVTNVGRDEDSNTGNCEGITLRMLRQRLFQKDQGELVKILHNIFTRKLFQNRRRVGKFVDDLFQHRLSMQELSNLLYGCITFETEWNNVRGINYVNELLTDTSVALEVKLMVKREFCEFDEALAFHGLSAAECAFPRLSQHFVKEIDDAIHPGGDPLLSTPHSTEFSLASIQERDIVDDFRSFHDSDSDCELLDAVRYFDVQTFSENMSCLDVGISDGSNLTNNNAHSLFPDAGECHTHGQSLVATDVNGEITFAVETMNRDWLDRSDFSDDESSSFSSHDDHMPTLYKDTFLLFRFNDPILPLDLKKVITADQRLLKMLESGLPSWAIFLQSYPVVSKLYRPWMCPLARTMYVLVSLITVIIGFYDLYKNVPILKATAARLCGPLFEWIEGWEMISRVKYLGTVLFLQNWEKAFQWLLLAVKTARKISAVVMNPIMGPLEEFAELIWWPVWNILFGSLWSVSSLIWMTVSSALDYTIDILQFIVWPFVILASALWKLVTMIIFAVWSVITLPLNLIILLLNVLIAIILSIFVFIQNIWILCSQLLTAVGPQAGKTAKSSASAWRVLWNDIFSQVFRAIRSIINVLVAFFTSCNRHRLSIYNHMSAFLFRFIYLVKGCYSRVAKVCCRNADTTLLALDDQSEGVLESSTVEFMPRNNDRSTSSVRRRNPSRNRRVSQSS